ncbi:hypothetical protein EYR36_007026 [Pleurotus pulmonarius]|nr:hypothetical protein EYR36_007026 [Pleurotus pulmonarius]
MKFNALIAISVLGAVASARPSFDRIRRAAFDLKNGQDAIALNNQFKTTKEGSPCQQGELKCVGDRFAQCVNGKLLSQACAPGTSCAAIPLDNKPGTLVQCTTANDLATRLAATGAVDANAGGNNGNNDPQTSLTLDPKVIAKGFANDGQDVPAAGQVASLTSTNNFINFCLTVPNLPITNGQQITSGSCNPAPIGVIPSVDLMPSSKFTFPPNMGTVPANKAFTISMAIKNLETGNFVNAQANYFAAPQQLNGQGLIKGHSHVVVEQIDSLTSTQVTNPKQFAFFKGLNAAAQGGILTADVTNGLPAGVYRLSSINSAANHQPAIAPVAQHGSLDDAIYFTVTDGAQAAGANAQAAAANAAGANAAGKGNAAGANAQAAPAKAAGNGKAAGKAKATGK